MLFVPDLSLFLGFFLKWSEEIHIHKEKTMNFSDISNSNLMLGDIKYLLTIFLASTPP